MAVLLDSEDLLSADVQNVPEKQGATLNVSDDDKHRLISPRTHQINPGWKTSPEDFWLLQNVE